MGRGASTPSQVLGVNIYRLLVSFARFVRLFRLLAALCCCCCCFGVFFKGGGGDRVVWENGGGEYRCKGAAGKHSLKHSNSSFVIFVRWTVNRVMTTWTFC